MIQIHMHTIKQSFYMLGLSIFALLISVGCSPTKKNSKTVSTQSKEQPNILFILLDDMGKEWVETYGAEEIHTPTIDQLAKDGMQFENSWSMPQCTPSRVTLITGQYPWRHGWINHFDVPRWGYGAQFDPNFNPSFARIMKTAGYKTCAAGKWQINDFRLQPEIMNAHGFDEYCMWTGGEGGNLKASGKRYWDPYIHTKDGSKTYKGKFGEDVFSDFIIDFMKENKEDPMLIYYPMCLPHGPLVSTPLSPDASEKMDKHKAMVTYTDFILNKLIAALEELKIRDNTIIVWTTDNGTGGNIIGTRNGRAVRGGKTYLTENGVNAPFIVNCPGKVPGGVVTDALVDFTDILPTFADLGNAKLPIKYIGDGQSFAPLLLGKASDSPRTWTMALGSRAARIKDGRVQNVYEYRDRAIRNKKYKAFVNAKGEINEIFDLSKDVEEERNYLYSKNAEVVANLRAFRKVLETLPEKDAQPRYKKLSGSLYDVDPAVLEKQISRDIRKSNHAPKANKK